MRTASGREIRQGARDLDPSPRSSAAVQALWHDSIIANDSPQTPEELGAHYGPEGPVHAAQQFFEALFRDRSLRAAYEFMTPELRRDRTDEWVEMNAGHPALASIDRAEVAERLAEAEPDHPLWSAYEESSIESFLATYSFVDLEGYGYASRPRPIGVDQELVLLVKGDPDTPKVFDRPTLISGAQFVVEHRGGRWLVAGFSRAYSPSELLQQGRSRDELIEELVTEFGGDREQAAEIFDRSLAEEND